MGRRAKTAPPLPPSQYKYVGKDECEENEDFHIVHPTVWPPKRTPTEPTPTVFLTCVNCGCRCPVDAENDEKVSGVRVVLRDGSVAAPRCDEEVPA